jgi:DnaA family protein
MAQLALPLRLNAHARFSSYVRGANALALAHLEAQAREWRGFVWLWGSAGAGRSHVLQASCAAAHATGGRAMYVPLGDRAACPEWLEGLDDFDFLALDDVDVVVGQADWELSLFRFFDAAQTARRGLLVAAGAAPQALEFALADLASRAAAAVVYRLQALDDARRLEAVRIQAHVRGLDLDEKAARYFVTHAERDIGALCRWLDLFDERSLAAQRKLTIPFIRAILEEATGGA